MDLSDDHEIFEYLTFDLGVLALEYLPVKETCIGEWQPWSTIERFALPSQIAIHDEEIYIVDSLSPSVRVFSLGHNRSSPSKLDDRSPSSKLDDRSSNFEVKLQREWALKVPHKSQYWHVNGLAISPRGILYVVDSVERYIYLFTRWGEFIRSWRIDQEPFNFPHGIVIAPQSQRIYITDPGGGHIYVFDLEVKDERNDKRNDERNEQNGANKLRQKWVLDGIVGPDDLYRPYGIALSHDEREIYTIDRHYLLCAFSSEGKLLWQQKVAEFNKRSEERFEVSLPPEIALSPRGEIYVVNSFTNTIYVFDKPKGSDSEDGSSLTLNRDDRSSRFKVRRWIDSFNYPRGIVVWQGRIYVADVKNHRVVVFRQDYN
jgi:DNA-binding beta-propeller fold protein YncE